MTSDEVADEVEYLQGRVTADMIKSYCGRGSQSLRGIRYPFIHTIRLVRNTADPYDTRTELYPINKLIDKKE